MITPSITFANREDLLTGKESLVTLELPFSKSDYENMLKTLGKKDRVTGKDDIIITHYISPEPFTKNLIWSKPDIYALNVFHKLYHDRETFRFLFDFRDDVLSLYKEYSGITYLKDFLDVFHPENTIYMFNIVHEKSDEGLARYYIKDRFFSYIYDNLSSYYDAFNMDELLTKYVTYLGKEILIEKDIFDDDEFREVLYEHLSKNKEFLRNVNIENYLNLDYAATVIYEVHCVQKKEGYYVVMDSSEYYSWSDEEKRELSGL